jgi:hypothetical protein
MGFAAGDGGGGVTFRPIARPRARRRRHHSSRVARRSCSGSRSRTWWSTTTISARSTAPDTRTSLRIAEHFNWSKFAPLIVAPVEGGKFAIIDGQHRATAAALRGVEMVPGQVVIADAAEQAAAFKAINGQVTRIHKLALQHAAISAGDPAAIEIRDVAAAAGVTDPALPGRDRWPQARRNAGARHADRVQPHLRRETLITALSCVTETENNKPGYLSAGIIKALCAVLAAHAKWREGGGALLSAFDEIDLDAEFDEAKCTRRVKGVATWEILSDRITNALTEHFQSEAA